MLTLGLQHTEGLCKLPASSTSFTQDAEPKEAIQRFTCWHSTGSQWDIIHEQS